MTCSTQLGPAYTRMMRWLSLAGVLVLMGDIGVARAMDDADEKTATVALHFERALGAGNYEPLTPVEWTSAVQHAAVELERAQPFGPQPPPILPRILTFDEIVARERQNCAAGLLMEMKGEGSWRSRNRLIWTPGELIWSIAGWTRAMDASINERLSVQRRARHIDAMDNAGALRPTVEKRLGQPPGHIDGALP